jgi:hypothetical protein
MNNTGASLTVFASDQSQKTNTIHTGGSIIETLFFLQFVLANYKAVLSDSNYEM